MTEHDDVIRLLNEGRPQATERELDEIKQRVRRRAARRSQSMKSRLAILGMLVGGMLFSTAGAGLAVQGLGSNASVAQYGATPPTPTPCVSPNQNGQSGQNGSAGGGGEECAATPTPEGGVLPASAEHENAPTSASGGGVSPAGGVTPAGGVAPATASQTTQPTRQEAATTRSQLPFTGFAAIPVLLGGLALLTGGLILRRRTRSE